MKFRKLYCLIFLAACSLDTHLAHAGFMLDLGDEDLSCYSTKTIQLDESNLGVIYQDNYSMVGGVRKIVRVSVNPVTRKQLLRFENFWMMTRLAHCDRVDTNCYVIEKSVSWDFRFQLLTPVANLGQEYEAKYFDTSTVTRISLQEALTIFDVTTLNMSYRRPVLQRSEQVLLLRPEKEKRECCSCSLQ